MRREIRLATFVAIIAAWCVAAPAQAIPLAWDFNTSTWAGTGESTVAMADIPVDGILVGDKLFTNFTNARTREGNATAPTAAGINLTGVLIAGDYGLKFTGNWSAFGDSSAESTIVFKVTATDPNWWIKDNGLALGAFGAWTPDPDFAPPSGVAISENVTAFNPDSSPILGGVNIANKFVFYESASNNKTVDEQNFYITPAQLALVNALPPVQQPNFILLPDDNLTDGLLPIGLRSAWVQKNIGVSGSAIGGSAHLSAFYQTFSQVPEPASLALLALGGLLITKPRRSHRA